MGLPRLDQYKTADNMSCSRTQHGYSAGRENHVLTYTIYLSKNTLSPSYKWPPYIFALGQKVKTALTKLLFSKKSKALSRLCKLGHFKMTHTPCTDEDQVEIPSFQKATRLTVV